MANEAFGECIACGRRIDFGNAMVTINRNIEQANRPDNSQIGEITVIDSTNLITLCASCGNRFHVDILRRWLMSFIRE
jgi:hypothetical protein